MSSLSHHHTFHIQGLAISLYTAIVTQHLSHSLLIEDLKCFISFRKAMLYWNRWTCEFSVHLIYLGKCLSQRCTQALITKCLHFVVKWGITFSVHPRTHPSIDLTAEIFPNSSVSHNTDIFFAPNGLIVKNQQLYI